MIIVSPKYESYLDNYLEFVNNNRIHLWQCTPKAEYNVRMSHTRAIYVYLFLAMALY